jgi:hypothetical protein
MTIGLAACHTTTGLRAMISVGAAAPAQFGSSQAAANPPAKIQTHKMNADKLTRKRILSCAGMENLLRWSPSGGARPTLASVSSLWAEMKRRPPV